MAITNKVWISKVRNYCLKYDIPLTYLADIINEPKVVPMIRGKAFEFSAMLRLQEILSPDIWLVDKPSMNAQFGFHDIDVRVIHKPTRNIISVECKLAGKGNYKSLPNGDTQIKVKCMRSRTLGASKVGELSKKMGIDEQLLSVHNDQYLPTDFEVVITSIGNAFYITDELTDLFEWQPDSKGLEFLRLLSSGQNIELQKFAYNSMFVASAESLAIKPQNNISCTRNKCTQKQSCGFIPNYPIIHFEKGNITPSNSWLAIENAETLFLKMLENPNLRIFEGQF